MLSMMLSANDAVIARADANQFASIISDYEQNEVEFVLLDVRTQREFDNGHFPKAIVLDYYAKDFRTKLAELDRSKKYLLYCRSGNRSGQTLRLMSQMGFTYAVDLNGGIVSWLSSGKKLVK